MKKSFGITLVLIAICVVTACLNPNFLGAYNLKHLVNWIALYGIISIGAALVITTGGIDLSIGSAVGFIGTLLPWLLVQQKWSVPAALAASLVVSLAIGLFHGFFVTKVKLQPFVVTLCGLMIYRGAGRCLTHDGDTGFGNNYPGLGQLTEAHIPLGGGYQLPISFVFLVVVAVAASVFLHQTVMGRHLMALGRNEEAARYSGVRTERLQILAYVLCALIAGFGGVLFALDVNSVQPASQGAFYELYAIAGAVLGGCSLRGGEASIFGVIIGTAVMRVLYNSINLLGLPTQSEFVIIGVVLLMGVTADETFRRWRKAS